MSEPVRPSSALLSKADKLRLASLVVMTGFAVAVAVHYFYGAYCGYRYPFDTYLFRPADSFELDPLVTANHDFSDLLAVCMHAADRDPYFTEIPRPFTLPQPFPSNYFPFGAMLSYPLSRIPYPWAVALFIGGFIGFLAWFNWTFLRTGEPLTDAIPIVTLTLMNYPAQYVVDRGNIEAFVFAFLAGFALLLVRRRPLPAAGLLGAAVAMKAVPIVFLPMCFRGAGRRGPIVALVTAAILTVAALLAMRSPVPATIAQFLENLGGYAANTSKELEPANHASGLYGLVVLADWTSQLTPIVHAAWRILKVSYPFIAAVILAGSMVASVMLPMRLWELATVAAVCLVLLPAASPDYRLIHMMIPFALFVNSRTPRRDGIVTTLLFALLFIPKSWVILASEVTLNSALNPLILLALLWRVLQGANARRRVARAASVASPAAAAKPPIVAAADGPQRRR